MTSSAPVLMPTSKRTTSTTPATRRKLRVTRKRASTGSARTSTRKARTTRPRGKRQKATVTPKTRGRRAAVTPTKTGAKGGTRTLPFVRLEDAPPDLQRRAYDRLAWVEAVVSRPKNQSVAAAIADHAQRLGLDGSDIPKRTTVDTWVRLAKVDGVLGLVDRVRSDAGTVRSLAALSPRVRARIGSLDELIEDVLVGMRGSAIDVYVALQKLLRRSEVSMSYHTVARHVRE